MRRACGQIAPAPPPLIFELASLGPRMAAFRRAVDADRRVPLSSTSGILRAPYFEFWCERSVLVFAGRGDQGQLVPASLYCPYAFRVSPWRKTCCLDFPDYFFSCFVHCIRAVIGDHRSIRLSRIICFHRGYWGTNNNLGEPVSPSERNLPLNLATPIVFLFAVLIFIESSGDDPRSGD